MNEILQTQELQRNPKRKRADIRETYIIWGTWVVLQTALLFYTEFVLTNWALQFFVGFVLSLVGQYVIFFATTKGKLAQRVFTMLTYSIFFCIVMSLVTMVNGTFGELHWTLTALIQAALLFAIVFYFLRYVCPRRQKCSDLPQRQASGIRSGC